MSYKRNQRKKNAAREKKFGDDAVALAKLVGWSKVMIRIQRG